jgi:hypothetical protein
MRSLFIRFKRKGPLTFPGNPVQHASYLRKKHVIVEYHETHVATARVTLSRRNLLATYLVGDFY